MRKLQCPQHTFTGSTSSRGNNAKSLKLCNHSFRHFDYAKNGQTILPTPVFECSFLWLKCFHPMVHDLMFSTYRKRRQWEPSEDISISNRASRAKTGELKKYRNRKDGDYVAYLSSCLTSGLKNPCSNEKMSWAVDVSKWQTLPTKYARQKSDNETWSSVTIEMHECSRKIPKVLLTCWG